MHLHFKCLKCKCRSSQNWSKRLSKFWKIPPQLHHNALLLFHEEMFLESIWVRGHVSRRPKSLVGSWTVFLTAESTGWIIADPHPEYWTCCRGRSLWFMCTVTAPHQACSALVKLSLEGWWWVTARTPTYSIEHTPLQFACNVEVGVTLGRSLKDLIKQLGWLFCCLQVAHA